MKKIIICLFCLIIILCTVMFFACGKDNGNTADENQKNDSDSVQDNNENIISEEENSQTDNNI